MRHPLEYKIRNKGKSKQTAKASKYPQGYFKPKPCKNCAVEFTPNAPSEMYCSDHCKDIGVQSAYLMRCYGITAKDYADMYEKQEGLCAICGGEGFTMKKMHTLKLVVDHCHTTGKVRGLLCHNCNRALGLMKDSIKNLGAAMEYLAT